MDSNLQFQVITIRMGETIKTPLTIMTDRLRQVSQSEQTQCNIEARPVTPSPPYIGVKVENLRIFS